MFINETEILNRNKIFLYSKVSQKLISISIEMKGTFNFSPESKFSMKRRKLNFPEFSQRQKFLIGIFSNPKSDLSSSHSGKLNQAKSLKRKIISDFNSEKLLSDAKARTS